MTVGECAPRPYQEGTMSQPDVRKGMPREPAAAGTDVSQ